MKNREQDLMIINQNHQKLVGSIMVQNRELIDDLKTIARILDDSNYLDNIREDNMKLLKNVINPYIEVQKNVA